MPRPSPSPFPTNRPNFFVEPSTTIESLRNSSTRCEPLASRCSSTPSKDPLVEKEEYHPKCALSSRHSRHMMIYRSFPYNKPLMIDEAERLQMRTSSKMRANSTVAFAELPPVRFHFMRSPPRAWRCLHGWLRSVPISPSHWPRLLSADCRIPGDRIGLYARRVVSG